jgi:hypothetical protein
MQHAKIVTAMVETERGTSLGLDLQDVYVCNIPVASYWHMEIRLSTLEVIIEVKQKCHLAEAIFEAVELQSAINNATPWPSTVFMNCKEVTVFISVASASCINACELPCSCCLRQMLSAALQQPGKKLIVCNPNAVLVVAYISAMSVRRGIIAHRAGQADQLRALQRREHI